MTLFVRLYCVIWIALLTGCSSTTGKLPQLQLTLLLDFLQNVHFIVIVIIL